MEEGGAAGMNTAQEKNKPIPAEKNESVANKSYNRPRAPSLLPPSPFLSSSRHPVLLPSVPLNIASANSCQLLDFFGENLAYIDESSDTLSDRGQPKDSMERRRRPRKPKRKSMRRQLSHKWSPLQVRRLSSEMQPPSNPPTPPPDSSLSSENQKGPTL